MSRTVCEHYVLLDEECKQCEFKYSRSSVQLLQSQLNDVQDMLNKRNNELANAREEIADLTRRLATITNLYGSNI